MHCLFGLKQAGYSFELKGAHPVSKGFVEPGLPRIAGNFLSLLSGMKISGAFAASATGFSSATVSASAAIAVSSSGVGNAATTSLTLRFFASAAASSTVATGLTFVFFAGLPLFQSFSVIAEGMSPDKPSGGARARRWKGTSAGEYGRVAEIEEEGQDPLASPHDRQGASRSRSRQSARSDL